MDWDAQISTLICMSKLGKTIDIDYYLIPRGLVYRTNSANVIEIKGQDMQEVSRRHSII